MPLLPIVLGLAQFAPSLMRFFGAGESSAAVAEQVANMAKTVTGASTPEEALAALRANAELQAKFQDAVLARDHELELAYLQDRKDARARDVAFIAAGRTNHRANAMLLMAFGAVVLIAALLALGKVDGATAVGGFLITVGGMFARNIGTAFDFEFGSSRGSREKDELLSKKFEHLGGGANK